MRVPDSFNMCLDASRHAMIIHLGLARNQVRWLGSHYVLRRFFRQIHNFDGVWMSWHILFTCLVLTEVLARKRSFFKHHGGILFSPLVQICCPHTQAVCTVSSIHDSQILHTLDQRIRYVMQPVRLLSKTNHAWLELQKLYRYFELLGNPGVIRFLQKGKPVVKC